MEHPPYPGVSGFKRVPSSERVDTRASACNQGAPGWLLLWEPVCLSHLLWGQLPDGFISKILNSSPLGRRHTKNCDRKWPGVTRARTGRARPPGSRRTATRAGGLSCLVPTSVGWGGATLPMAGWASRLFSGTMSWPCCPTKCCGSWP